MSSTQETHLLPPPKPKLSPLELRNTDLVSRLLAATPPYLYNMSLLPNTYFFSEMLRSFVQAKNEQNAQRGNIGNGFGANANMFYGHTMRRSRKRGWNNIGRENVFQPNSIVEEKVEKSVDKIENNEPWMLKSMRKNEENALELTTNSENIHQKLEDHRPEKPPKFEEQPLHFTPQQENSSNLVLPPPPPIWYPPVYPTPPYGIDPLHFFIDLRVSGHIYDKHNNNQGKEGSSNLSPRGHMSSTTVVDPNEAGKSEVEQKEIKIEESIGDIFRQKRHCSAFSVPNNCGTSKNRLTDKSQTRFDVKSMGFDKSSNKMSTNYVMGNISNIYKSLSERQIDAELNQSTEDLNIDVNEKEMDEKFDTVNSTNATNLSTENSREVAEKERKAKDLRALIGLELVVDYMSHKKGEGRRPNSSCVVSEEEPMSSELESVGSPPLEVVAVQDDA